MSDSTKKITIIGIGTVVIAIIIGVAHTIAKIVPVMIDDYED